MGIRFLCPNGHKLNVKEELAGKSGVCPDCGTKFVIPATSTGPPSGIVDSADSALVETVPAPAGPAAWYLRPPSGGQYGPVAANVFADWIAEGRVTTDAYVWHEGWPQWRTALDSAELLPTQTHDTSLQVPDSTPRLELAAVDSQIPEAIAFARPSPAIAPVIEEDVVATPQAARRAQIRQIQIALAVIMFLAVVILAGVLIWVLRRNPVETVTTEPAAAMLLSAESRLA